MYKKKQMVVRKGRTLTPIGHDFQKSGDKGDEDNNVSGGSASLRVVKCGQIHYINQCMEIEII